MYSQFIPKFMQLTALRIWICSNIFRIQTKTFPLRKYLTDRELDMLWFNGCVLFSSSSIHQWHNTNSLFLSRSICVYLGPYVCLEMNVCKPYNSDCLHGSFWHFLNFALFPTWNLLVSLIFLLHMADFISLTFSGTLSQQLQANFICYIVHKSL